MKKKVHSYDMFDTLFSRKGITPESIFEEVATAVAYHSKTEFIKKRKEAEKSLYGSNYTIYDIYQNMDVDRDIQLAGPELELAIEEDQLIPIIENINKLKPNDIVISDMYLDQSFLKAHLPNFVNVVVTNDGKRTGKVFEELLKHYDIISHTGDNITTDVASPAKHGIKSHHYTESALTSTERNLTKFDLQGLSKELRKIRLEGTEDDLLKEKIRMCEIEVNLPMLALIALEIKDVCDKLDITKVLFSSRDCHKLHYIWKQMFNTDVIKSDYFWTSRMSRKKASHDYLEYIKKSVEGKTLIVDLNGTGWTLRNLKAKMEDYDSETAKNIEIYLFQNMDESKMDGFITRPYSVPNYQIYSTFFGNKYQHNRLELINLAGHPMVKDVKMIMGNPVVDFYKDGPDDKTKELIKVMDEPFLEFISALSDYETSYELFHISKENRVVLLDMIYDSLSNYDSVIFDELGRQQKEEEEDVEKELKSI